MLKRDKPIIEIESGYRDRGNPQGSVTIGPVLFQQIRDKANELGVPMARLIKAIIMYGLRELELRKKNDNA